MKVVRKKTTVIVILVGLTMLIGASTLYAQFGQRWGGAPGEHLAMVSLYLTKQLNLDASQQAQLETITQGLMAKGKTLHQMRKNTRVQLASILRADSVDAQAIQALQDQNRGIIDDFITEIGTRLTEFVNMLTPEQRQLFATVIESHGHGCGFPAQ